MTSSSAKLHFPVSEYEQRLSNVRRKMAERGIRIFLSHTPENLYYLTGYQTSGYYMYQTLIVPEDGDPLILTRYSERTNVLAGSWVQNMGWYVDTQDPVEVTYQAMVDAGLTQGPIGIEKESWFLTVKRYEQLAGLLGSNTELVDVSGLVESLRVVKSPAEVDHIRRASLIANAGMQAGIENSDVGRTEDEVAAAIHNVMVGMGGEYTGLPVFIGSGPRAFLTHPTWEGRCMERGDIVAIELAGCVKRYASALFRTIYLGDNPPDLVKRMNECVSETLNMVIDTLRPGIRPEEVASKNRDIRTRYGFESPGRTGYSIGINFPPDWGEGHALSLWGGETRPLEPGMVFHTPINIRLYGEAFMASSETILITPTGSEALTNCPPRQLILKN